MVAKPSVRSVDTNSSQGVSKRLRDATLLSRPGGLAQLGEHLLCKQGVSGSIPLSSTTETLALAGVSSFLGLVACWSEKRL